MTNVEFYEGGVLLGADTTPPYSYFWQNVPSDLYQLTAVAYDNFGDTSTSSVAHVYVVVSTAPTVESFNPPGGNISSLRQVTVNFGEPVDGVDAADLLINGVPATSVTGANAQYTFTFPQPTEGLVNVTWAADAGILDREDPPQAFNTPRRPIR